jgi:hypothetical protein
MQDTVQGGASRGAAVGPAMKEMAADRDDPPPAVLLTHGLKLQDARVREVGRLGQF